MILLDCQGMICFVLWNGFEQLTTDCDISDGAKAMTDSSVQCHSEETPAAYVLLLCVHALNLHKLHLFVVLLVIINHNRAIFR